MIGCLVLAAVAVGALIAAGAVWLGAHVANPVRIVTVPGAPTTAAAPQATTTTPKDGGPGKDARGYRSLSSEETTPDFLRRRGGYL